MLHEVFILPLTQQPHDHSGDPVAPLTSAGTPFNYSILDLTREQITYATTADALLTTLISDYQPTNPDDPHHTTGQDVTEHYLAQGRVRTEYAYGVAVNNLAQAVIADELTPDAQEQLKRSLRYSPPVTMTELPQWDHPTPMLLVASPYLRDHLAPPAGNVVMLDPTTPETLIHSLAEVGAIDLRRHTRIATPRSITPAMAGEPDPTEFLTQAIADLDMLLSNLNDPDHLPHHRTSMHVLANRLHTWAHHPDHLTPPLEAITHAHDDPGALVSAGQELREVLVQLQTETSAEDSDGSQEPGE